MGLTYYYRFRANKACKTDALHAFLTGVEVMAKARGFSPTGVLQLKFETAEQRVFARRLGASFVVGSDDFKGIAAAGQDSSFGYTPSAGSRRLIPEAAVVLVVTDEQKREACFGFLRFPAEGVHSDGKKCTPLPWNGDWIFHDFINTPDPRFREIVKAFADAGFLEEERDDFGG